MTQQEIIEGNKLIAEFMGLNIGHDGKKLDPGVFTVNGYITTTTMLKYHSSWDCLMPVVEKIASTVIKGRPPFNSDQFVRVELNVNGYVKIENLRDTPIFTNVSIEGSLINATYKAVIQFIRWYNNQPKQ